MLNAVVAVTSLGIIAFVSACAVGRGREVTYSLSLIPPTGHVINRHGRVAGRRKPEAEIPGLIQAFKASLEETSDEVHSQGQT